MDKSTAFGIIVVAVTLILLYATILLDHSNTEMVGEPGERLQLVLDYCNDTSGFKNSILIYHSNTTHSIDNIDCKWKEHGTYPNSENLCIPYVDKWVTGEDWRNQTHYFDTNSCKWKEDPEYDELNSKGCPQFCPKNATSTVFSFCGEDGFSIDGHLLTNNSTHYFDHDECQWTEGQHPRTGPLKLDRNNEEENE